MLSNCMPWDSVALILGGLRIQPGHPVSIGENQITQATERKIKKTEKQKLSTLRRTNTRTHKHTQRDRFTTITSNFVQEQMDTFYCETALLNQWQAHF